MHHPFVFTQGLQQRHNQSCKPPAYMASSNTTMNGVLFKYGPGSANIAFKSAASRQHPLCRQGELHLVLVGGLTDGLLFAPYAQELAAAVGSMGWTLVQAQLTSSYQGWGLSSLDQDASELQLLAQHLAQAHDSRAWVLMGHSTGCQDAVRYVQRHHAQDLSLAGVILQAPVSDREYLATFPSWQDKVQQAQELVQQGRGSEVVFRVMEWDGAAVTAQRLMDLCCPRGDDDMFSTDLSQQQLQPILGPLHYLPCLILQSGADESVPQHLRDSGAVQQLGQRLLQAVQLGTTAQQSSGGVGPVPEPAAAAAGDGSAAAKEDDEDTSDTHSATDAELDGRENARNFMAWCQESGTWEQVKRELDLPPDFVPGAPSSSHRAHKRPRAKSMPQELHALEGAGHACAGHVGELVEVVSQFLERLPLTQLD